MEELKDARQQLSLWNQSIDETIDELIMCVKMFHTNSEDFQNHKAGTDIAHCWLCRVIHRGEQHRIKTEEI